MRGLSLSDSVSDPMSPVKALGWALGIGLVLYLMINGCGGSDDRSAGSATTTTTTAWSAPATTKAPYEHQHMPGDGYHNIGGIDGKDWGTWVSTGSSQPCSWSVRVTDPYGPATVLREGGAGAGEVARVVINPPGSVSSISGALKSTGGRVVFQTSGCGSWTHTR